jgi:hypothetical protein
MFEYILFSKPLRDRFTAFLEEHDVEYQCSDDDEHYLIMVSEDIDENLEDIVEQQYDILLDENARLTDEEDNSSTAIHLVGIQFTDNYNKIKQVKITPELASKIQHGLNTVELQAFVQQIADAVYDSDNTSLCQL